jgi:magnesium transporter
MHALYFYNMLERYTHNNLTWVDLQSPTHTEVASIAAEFGIDGLIAEELLLPSTKPRAEFRETYAYLILHFPALRHTHKTREQEVDFVVGKNFIITTRYDMVDPLHKFAKVFETNTMLEKSAIGEHAGFLLFYMLKKMYKAIEHEIEFIRHDLGIIEDHIFKGHEVTMVEAISKSSRDLLNLRQTIEPHREVLRDLEAGGAPLFGSDFVQYFRTLSNEYYRVHNHIMRHTESLHELRETNNSLLTTKQNETMRALTVMALLTFPLALVVAVLDADTLDNPLNEASHGLLILIVLVIALGSSMLLYFKHRKWI